MYWGGVLTSCSNGSEDTEPDGIEKTISGVDEVTFTVTNASVGAANTNIVFTYARSKDGAKEKITIKDCDIEVLLNGEKQKTIKRLDFALNEYGDFMGDKATQYQCKISIEKKVAPGDIVKVVFNKKTGNLIGEGTESALINKLTVSLIDNDKEAGDDGYYNELVESENEYQSLFPNGGESGEGGDGNGGSQGSGNGTGNGGQGGGEQGNGGAEGGGAGQGNGGNGDGGQGGSGSGEQDNGNTPVKGDEKITFSVTEDSTNAENTTLIFKYDRGAAGAKELVAIENCGIVVEVNDTVVKTIAKLEFALDEYGASFDENDKNPVKDEKNMKEYKAKVSLGKQVKKGDKVVVYYNKGVGTITGEGKDAEAVKFLIVSLIDTDEAVKYYKELADNADEYQPLFPDINEGGNQGNQGENNNDNNQGNEGNNNNQGNGNESENSSSGNGKEVTVTDCKTYEVVVKDEVEDASIVGIVFQIDNPNPEKGAEGLKINISNLKIAVTVGDEKIGSVEMDSVTMIPNEWAEVKWSKTDARIRLELPAETKLEKDTKITVQIQSATIDQPEETVSSIVFALQKDGGDYAMVGTDDTMWKSIFAKN